MVKLIYAANISLDGYLEGDETGSFDWSVPYDEVHAFWNEHERCGSPEIVEGSLCRVSGEGGGLVVDR